MIRLIKIKKKDILIRQLRSKDADKNYLNMIKNANNFILSKNASKNTFLLRKYIHINNISVNNLLLGIFVKDLHIGNIKFEIFSGDKAILGIFIGNKNYQGKNLFFQILKILEPKLIILFRINTIYLGVNKKIFLLLKHLQNQVLKFMIGIKKNLQSNNYEKKFNFLMFNFSKKKYIKALNNYKFFKFQNELGKLPELRLFIEQNIQLKHKDKLFHFFLKNISSTDYYSILNSHLISHTLNLRFNFSFYLGVRTKFKFPLPRAINNLIEKKGIKISKMNLILWKLSIIKKFLKNNIKIIKQIKIKKNNIPNEFLYVYNNEKNLNYFRTKEKFNNNFIWLAKKFNCKSIVIPNLNTSFNVGNNFYVYNFNNFHFSNIRKLIFFYLTLLLSSSCHLY